MHGIRTRVNNNLDRPSRSVAGRLSSNGAKQKIKAQAALLLDGVRYFLRKTESSTGCVVGSEMDLCPSKSALDDGEFG